jgi:putative membrane protein insertion efficiency factor
VNKALVRIIQFYRRFISPALEKVFGKACRFTPTCSEYTIEALEKFGTKKGITLGIKRLARCHPWGGSGYDPLPTKN